MTKSYEDAQKEGLASYVTKEDWELNQEFAKLTESQWRTTVCFLLAKIAEQLRDLNQTERSIERAVRGD